MSKETNRRFFIHAPTTFDSSVVPAGRWNATLPSVCRKAIVSPIYEIDKPPRFHKVAAGTTPCVAVRVNHDYHAETERKQALAELFLPIDPPKHRYAAVHLRTGGHEDYAGIDPPRDSVAKGLAMLSNVSILWNAVHIVSDSLEAKARLAHECRKTHAICKYRAGVSRHIDKQTTSNEDLAAVWDDFRDIAGATCVEHSRSGFSKLATIWPGSPHTGTCQF